MMSRLESGRPRGAPYDAANEHDRRDDHDVEGHDQNHLNLLDVVGVARDQRRSPEDRWFSLWEKLITLREDRAAHMRPNAIAVLYRRRRNDGK